MSQLILDPNFWVLVSFLILVGGGFSPLKKKALSFFKQRQETIQCQLREAEAILVEATKLEKQALSHMDAVEAQVQEILVLAEQEAAHLKKRLKAEEARNIAINQHALAEYRKMLISKFQKEISQALMIQAEKDALNLIAKHRKSPDFSGLAQTISSD